MLVAGIAALIAGIGTLIGTGVNAVFQSKQNRIQEDQLALAQKQQSLAEDQWDVELESMRTGLENDLLTMDTNLEEIQQNKSNYETALANFGQYADIQKSTAQEQGRNTFNQLLGNYEGTQVALAAQGRTAGSGAAVTEQSRNALQRFAGADLAFNTTGGGLFAKQYQQLESDLGLKKQEIQSQIDIFSKAETNTEEAIANTEEEIDNLGVTQMQNLKDKMLQDIKDKMGA